MAAIDTIGARTDGAVSERMDISSALARGRSCVE